MHTETVGPSSTRGFGGVSLVLTALQPVDMTGTTTARYPTAAPLSSLDVIRSSVEASPLTMQAMLHVVSALINAVNCALSGESDHAREYLGEAFRSLDRIPPAVEEVLSAADHPTKDKYRGGLAPWQIRRVSTHIEEHLSETIQCDDLARLVRLSLSHFMRAFRDSFGCPPHAFLMKRRMERAQGLMLTTDSALGHIALECGLADQSHLSRLFQKFVGESPAAWRRARVNATAL